MVSLDDDDPLWEQHSGGDGHRGVEWGDGDGAIAEAFYAALPTMTRFVFDLLMDRPGERLTSDWIAAQMSSYRADAAHMAGRRADGGRRPLMVPREIPSDSGHCR